MCRAAGGGGLLLLGNAERLRAVLAAPDATVATLRACTLEWLGQVGKALPDAPTVIRLVRGAGTAVELRGILRSRVADPSRAEGLGRRAAVEGATLVAACPYIPGTGAVAVRLYCLAGINAEACCPVLR